MPNSPINHARRKLEDGLITLDEFNVIADCDVLASFNEEGLQSPGAIDNPADEAREKLASGVITLQEARSIIDNHLAVVAAHGSDEDKTHLTEIVNQWRRESSQPSPSSWTSWIWASPSSDEVGSVSSGRSNSGEGVRESSAFLSRPRTSSRLRTGSAEISNSVLDPRVEVCIVVYSDAICAYNDIQAEAQQSLREDMKTKQEIEERLERTRKSRKHFLEDRLSTGSQNSESNQTSSQQTVSKAVEEDNTPWFPGKRILKHFASYSSDDSGRSSPASTPKNGESKPDEAAEEVEASAWRSIARELLEFEEASSSRAEAYATRISTLKAKVDKSFEVLEALSLELHELEAMKKKEEGTDEETTTDLVEEVTPSSQVQDESPSSLNASNQVEDTKRVSDNAITDAVTASLND